MNKEELKRVSILKLNQIFKKGESFLGRLHKLNGVVIVVRDGVFKVVPS